MSHSPATVYYPLARYDSFPAILLETDVSTSIRGFTEPKAYLFQGYPDRPAVLYFSFEEVLMRLIIQLQIESQLLTAFGSSPLSQVNLVRPSILHQIPPIVAVPTLQHHNLRTRY